jgi:hypothetical protein
LESASALVSPTFNPKTGMIATTSTASARPIAQKRLRVTPRAQELQARLAWLSCRTRGQSIRGPIPPSSAGSSVSTTMIEMSGISIPPIPVLRSPGTGSTTRDTRPIATVSPERSTARPAVSTARITAEALSRPRARSSRQRVTSSNE